MDRMYERTEVRSFVLKTFHYYQAILSLIKSKDLIPVFLCPFGYFHAFFIFEFPKYDDKEIYKAPDSKTANGKKLYDARDDFAYIKTVSSEHTKEKR